VSPVAVRVETANNHYSGLAMKPGEPVEEPRNDPAFLEAILRVLESRGPKESMNMLRDIMESMKLVQAITGTGAAASFVHANAYSDTRGEAFGVLTALSTILALMALIVTVIIYVSLGLLEHDDMRAVEGYLVRYWVTISGTIVSSVLSMILLVVAVVLDALNTYSRASGLFLVSTASLGLIGAMVFTVNSGIYVFSTSSQKEGSYDPDDNLSGVLSKEGTEVSIDEDDGRSGGGSLGMMRCR